MNAQTRTAEPIAMPAQPNRIFNARQVEALRAPLSRGNVSSREQAGRKFSYIEAWWTIHEANDIFGFDAWSRETVDIRCVAEHARKVGKAPQRDGWGVSYIAKVRVTVGPIVREGTGAGHGIDADLGLAHESAIKEAESDAMKRALMTFGNPFGLALYDKEQSEVANALPPQTARARIAEAAASADPHAAAEAIAEQWTDKQAKNLGNAVKSEPTVCDRLCGMLKDIKSVPELDKWIDGYESAFNSLPMAQQSIVKQSVRDTKQRLKRGARTPAHDLDGVVIEHATAPVAGAAPALPVPPSPGAGAATKPVMLQPVDWEQYLRDFDSQCGECETPEHLICVGDKQPAVMPEAIRQRSEAIMDMHWNRISTPVIMGG